MRDAVDRWDRVDRVERTEGLDSDEARDADLSMSLLEPRLRRRRLRRTRLAGVLTAALVSLCCPPVSDDAPGAGGSVVLSLLGPVPPPLGSIGGATSAMTTDRRLRGLS